MIASALPFSFILMLSTYGLLRALAIDAAKKESLNQTNLAPATSQKPVPWETRLNNLVHFPRRAHVKRFKEQVVIPAMEAVAAQLVTQGIATTVEQDQETNSPTMNILHGEEIDFTYQVFARAYLQPSFMLVDEDEEERKYFRAEVFLREGGQDYDIMGWSTDQVIADIVSQYEKHLHFLHMVR